MILIRITLLLAAVSVFSSLTFGQFSDVIKKGDVYYLANTLILKVNNAARGGETDYQPDGKLLDLLKGEGIKSSRFVLDNSSGRLNKSLSQIVIIEYSSFTDPEILASKVSRLPEVEWCEPKFLYEIDYVPNDPLYSSQYALTKIEAPQAWDITKGDSSIVIAIIDTGVDWDHPDLAANIWRNPGEIPGNGLDDDANGFIDDVRGWDFGGLTGIADNNPMEDRPDHGTHVAGIASAVTDNNTGVSSIGYKSRIMPVKTSRDDVRTSTGQALISYGYQGIVYAADNGAKVINLSWGGSGYSVFGQEIINYATNQGALVVGAAGNAQSYGTFYPASYDGVISVASVNQSDVRSTFSNYDITVDVSAPGTSINGTWQNDTYAFLSGTSMSAPLTAGLAALVIHQFPLFSPLQVGEQIRTNSDDINALNPSYNFLLGRGRINAFKAVSNTTSKSVRANNFSFSDDAPLGDDDGIFEPGETISVLIDFTNFLNTVDNLVITLEPLNNHSTIVNGTFNAGQKGTLESFNNSSSPLSFKLNNIVPNNAEIRFKINFIDGSYTDYQLFRLIVNPSYADQSNGNILLTIGSDGTLGYTDFPNNSKGNGFRYKGEPSLLFEGALMIGTSATRLSDAARVTQNRNQEFTTVQPIIIQVPGASADQEGLTIFNDLPVSANKVGVSVNLRSYSYSNEEDNDYIILRYNIKNTGTSSLDGLFTGLFFDWDYGDASSDSTGYDPTGNLGYVYRTVEDTSTWVATASVSTSTGFYAIRNDGTQGNINLFDANGFTDAEKWLSISSGVGVQGAGPGDISHVVSSGPYSIAAGDSVDAAFVIAAGNNIDEIRTSVFRARTKFQAILVDVKEDDVITPLEYSLSQNYPNPFNPTTKIGYSVPEVSRVSIKLYDVLGSELKTLVDEIKEPGSYVYNLNAGDISTGVYFYKLKAGNFTQTRKMVYLK